MKKPSNIIKLKKFEINDIKTLSYIMKKAFDKDSQMFLGEDGGPDGYDNGDFLRKWFMHKNATPLTIVYDEQVIGGVNLWINNETKKNFLGCIFIDPEFEDKGIGTKTWKMIEEMFPDTIEWTTETPIFSRRNHNFYVNKCGFAIVRIENPKDYQDGSYILKKKMR